jgi:hypothetical protein
MLRFAPRAAVTCLTMLLLAAIALLSGSRTDRMGPFPGQINVLFPMGTSGPSSSRVDCNADLFYKLLAEHSQSPLTVSPDGTMILLRALGQSQHFGLAIEAIKERRLMYRLYLDGEVLHPTWSHNGQYVAFFLQDSTHSLRSLYIWNLRTNTSAVVTEAVSYAEQRVEWSPDDRYIAYSETFHGVYLVNVERRTVAKLDIQNIVDFEWDYDNALRTITRGSDSTTILRLSADRSVRDSYTIPFRFYTIGKGTLRPADGVLLGTVENSDHSTTVVFMDLNRHRELGRRRFNKRLTGLQWFDNHNYVAEIVRGPYRNVLICNADTTRCQRLTRGAEVDDIVRVDGTHGNILYTRRGESPEELRLVNTKTRASTSLDQAPTGDLPVLSPIPLRLGPEADGNTDGYLWCPHSGATAAIIRLHGRNSSEMPVWQDDVAAANRVGICYLTINFEDAVPLSNLQRIVRNGSVYLQRRLHIQPRRIVLLGYSAGAEDGLFVSASVRDSFGLLVLVCLSERSALAMRTMFVSEDLSVALVEPRFDRESESGTLAGMVSSLKKHGIREDHLVVRVVNDTHLLVHPQSWMEIYGQIFSFLRIGDCDASQPQ